MGCCTKLCTTSVRQHLAAIGVGHGTVAVGVLLAWTSLAIPQLKLEDAFDQMSATSEAWISNISLLGAVLAVVPAGLLVDQYGRRLCMLLSSVPIVLGWILIIFANSLGILYVGRFIAGMSCGAFSVVLPIYLTEFAQPRSRGMIGYSFMQHLFAGVLFVTIVGHVMGFTWKILVFKSIPVVILFFVAAYFLPESPFYLFSTGQQQRGSDALKWFRATSSPQSIETEVKEIQSSFAEVFNLDNDDLESHKSNEILKQVGIPSVLMFLQQCTCGLPVILGTVAVPIFPTDEIMSSTSLNVVITVTALISIAISAHLVDRLGRRPLLLISCLVMSSALFLLGLSLYAQTDPVTEKVKWIRLVSLATFVSAFSCGLGPISWLLMAELAPASKKGFWVSIVTLFNWAPAFVIGMYYPLVIYWLTLPGFIWASAFVSICTALFSYLFVPETKNKSMTEIQAFFEDMLKMEYPI